ncbi:MAG: biotin--[acetyl-CoA-carboxylase] ligase [Candidatus Syntrophopropionicum ammoniitolerans]
MLSAVAVASAIEQKTGLKTGIKWPNDLLVGGKKICGILTELGAEMAKINYLVIGIGINTNQDAIDFPVELQGVATALKNELKRKVNRVRLLQAMLVEFER